MVGVYSPSILSWREFPLLTSYAFLARVVWHENDAIDFGTWIFFSHGAVSCADVIGLNESGRCFVTQMLPAFFIHLTHPA